MSDEAPPAGDRLQLAMLALEGAFPDCAIALVVAPFGAAPGRRANYISNGSREEMRVMLKEIIARWEGRGHDAPKGRQ